MPCPSAQVEAARQDPEILTLAGELIKRGGSAARELQVVLAGLAATEGGTPVDADASGAVGEGGALLRSMEDLQAGPGGRHDNDFADYRSINIVPTAAEVSI